MPRLWILAVQLGVHTQDNEADEGDDGKGGAQDAACEAAGVPTSASDISYEDETGVGAAGIEAAARGLKSLRLLR